MPRRPKAADVPLDLELGDLPPNLRRREWMGRVDAGHLRLRRAGAARKSRPRGGQGVQPRSDHRRYPRRIARAPLRARFGRGRMDVTHETGVWAGDPDGARPPEKVSRSNALVLMAIGYFQPITRGELSQFL